MASELFPVINENPQDVRAFETLIKDLVSEDNRERLGELYVAIPEWMPGNAQNHMLRMLGQQVRSAESESLKSWLSYKNGMTFWKAYDDFPMAEMSFRKIKTLPEEEGAKEALREFYTTFYIQQENWSRLEQALSDPSKGGMDSKTEVWESLAALAEEAGNPERAVAFWSKLIKEEPEHPEAELALRRLYASTERWNALADLLQKKVEREEFDDVEDKVLIYLELVELYDKHLNAPTKVVNAWKSILELQPEDLAAYDALAKVYEDMNRWPDLVKVLEEKVGFLNDKDEAIALRKEIANIYQERFNNANEAIVQWNEILELEPSHREAIETLKEIYEQRHDYDQYIALSERQIDLIEDGNEQLEALLVLSRLASERIRKAETPIGLWNRVLDGDPQNAEALEELETWYEREREWAALADVLERRIAIEGDDGKKVELLSKLGHVFSSRLEDESQAEGVWRRVLELDKDDRKAQSELRKKYLEEKNWDELEWFFRSYGDVSEWVRTVERQIRSMEEPEEKLPLLLKMAEVWRDELGDVRRAAKNLEAILELDPGYTDAARALIPIYQELRSFRELPEVYALVLDATDETEERKALLLALAKLYETELQDSESAFFNYVQAASEAPSDVSLHPKLRELAEHSGNWESYVHVLQNASEQLKEDDDERVRIFLEIGQILRDRLGAEEYALDFFYKVLTLDPYNELALDAAEAAWEATGQFDQLVLAYRKRLERLSDPEARQKVNFKLVALWRGPLEANDEAIALLEDILMESPTDLRVHDLLIEVYFEEARYAALRDVLGQKYDVLLSLQAQDALLADIEYELGVLAYAAEGDESAGDAGLALDWFEKALQHDQAHEKTVERLEELLCLQGHSERVAGMLLPVYERSDDKAKLAQILELQWEFALEDEDVLTQQALLQRLKELYSGEDLGLGQSQEELRWRTDARLFTLEPENAALRQEFEDLSEGLGRWQELVTLYGDQVDAPTRSEDRLAIALKVARTYESKLSDAGDALQEAERFYEKVTEEERSHQEALRALERIYEQRSKFDELLSVYEVQMEVHEAKDDKLSYYFRAMDLESGQREELDHAIGLGQEALLFAPTDESLISRMDDLYLAKERYEDLADLLKSTISLVESDKERTINYKDRLAEVDVHFLGAEGEAIALQESVLETLRGLSHDERDAWAGDVNAYWDRALTSLESLFAKEEWAPKVAPILQPVYEENGDWKRLIEVYKVLEEVEFDSQKKVEWHFMIAALYEGPAGDLDQAFSQLQAAFGLNPSDAHSLSELLRLSERMQNEEVLVPFLQGSVEDISDMGRRIETHRIIVALCREKTQDMASAEQELRAILELDFQDLEAIDALISLYRETGQDEALINTLVQKAQLPAMDANARKELYLEAGELASTRLEDPSRAIEIFETLRQLDNGKKVALEALSALYEGTEQWDELVQNYRAQIELEDALEKKKVLAGKMAFVQAGHLEQRDDAIMTWKEVLEWDAHEREALAELDLLYGQIGDWFNLKDVLGKIQEEEEYLLLELQEELGEEEAPKSTPAWDLAQYRIAGLYENPEQLGNIKEAVDAYGLLLERNPEYQDAIERLKGLVAGEDGYELAFQTLSPVLRSLGAFEALYEEYGVLLMHEDMEPEAKNSRYHEMASLAEHELQDPERAMAAYAEALQENPRSEDSRKELERVAKDYQFFPQLVDIYHERGEDADDDLLRLSFALRKAEILMDELSELPLAQENYEAILADEPEHKEVLERLHLLYETQENWEALARTIRSQADLEMEPQGRVAFLSKLANIQEYALSDKEAAYKAYLEVLDLDRQHEASMGELRRLFEEGVAPLELAEQLELLYREQSRFEDLDGLYQGKLTYLEDESDKEQLFRDLALLSAEERQNKEDAIRWYGEALFLSPDDEGLVFDIERLATETGRWDLFSEILNRASEATDEGERKVELWMRAGGIARQHMEDPALAESFYRKVIGLEPFHVGALHALDELLSGSERNEDIEAILVSLSRADDVFDDERVSVWKRLGVLYREKLGHPELAITAFNEVVELRESDEEALQALRALYLESKAWDKLFECLSQLSEITHEPDVRVEYLLTMAEIAEQYLDDPKRSIALYEEVLALQPEDLEVIRQLERLLLNQAEGTDDEGEMVDSYGLLAEAYERELRMTALSEDGERQLELLSHLGRLWEGPLADSFNAQHAWARARALAPHEREILDALKRLYAADGNDMEVIGVLNAQLQSGAYSEEESLAQWRELGQLQVDMGNFSAAVVAWESALHASSQDSSIYKEAVRELEGLYENTQSWESLVGLLERKVALQDEPLATAEVLLYKGRVEEQQLSQPALAVESYHRVLELPDLLEGEDEKASWLEASYRLEMIYETREEWSQLADLLSLRDRQLGHEDKVQNRQRLVALYEQKLGSQEEALGAALAVHELIPQDMYALSELERLAEATELWEPLDAAYAESLQHLEDDDALQVLFHAAALKEQRLGDAEGAMALYDKVLQGDPEHEKALRALLALTEAAGANEKRVQVLATLAEVTPDFSERHDLIQTKAKLYEEALEDLDHAIASYRELMDMNERDEEAFKELERLYIEVQDWPALVALYEKDAEVFPERELERTLQVAQIYEGYIQDVDAAIVAYEKALELHPGHDAAIEKLEEIYGEREDYDALLEVYERGYEAAQDEANRLYMVRNAAILQEAFRQDNDAAIEAWHRVLQIEPLNEEANENMQRIFQASERYDEWVDLHELRYHSMVDTAERVKELMALAAVHRDKRQDADDAISSYENVLLEDPKHLPALDALDELLQEKAYYDALVDVLGKKVDVVEDPTLQGQLLVRQGLLLRDELMSPGRAVESFTRALDLLPGEPTAIEALLGIYREEERFDKVLECLSYKLGFLERQADISDTHVDIAEVLGSKFHRTEEALQHFEAAEKANPESQRALEVLADHYFETGLYAKSLTRLEALVDKVDETETERLGDIYERIGLTSEPLFLDDQAIDALHQAESLRGLGKNGLLALGRLYYKKEDYAKSSFYLESLLEAHRYDLEPEHQVDILMLLGQSLLRNNETAKAQDYLHQVVDAQPSNEEAIEGIIEVLKDHGEYEEAIVYLERLLKLKTDDLEKYQILLAIGDISNQELDDQAGAILAYRAALDLDASPKVVALRLFELYLHEDDHVNAFSNLNRLIKAEDNPRQRAKYAEMAAVLCKEKLNDPMEAIKYYNYVLDSDLSRLSAFESIVKILTEAKDHKALEQNYRRMIERARNHKGEIENEEGLMYQLFMGLGEIYRSRLKEPQKAAPTFELALSVRPESAKIREILVELYVQTDELDKGISQQRWLLEHEPANYEYYRELAGLFKRAKRYDAAWCVTALLVGLQRAQDTERQFYEAYASTTPPPVNRMVDHSLWAERIVSSREDLELTQLFEYVYVGLGKSLLAKNPRDYDVKKKTRLDLSQGLLVTNIIQHVLSLYGMPAPEMHKTNSPVGIEFLQTSPPMLRFGANVLKGATPAELAFQVARHLSYFVSGHVIPILYPRAALDGLYLGASLTANPDYQVNLSASINPEDQKILMEIVTATRDDLERNLSQEQRQHLTALLRSIWSRTAVPRLGEWHRGVELTAIHAGLVAANDPAVAFGLIQSENQGMSALKKQDKLKDLVLYTISESYLNLREFLGHSIDYSELMG